MESHEQFLRSLAIDIHRAVYGDVLDTADTLDRKPVLLDLSRLVWRNPRIVRLVVAPAANHQFKIRTVAISQYSIPYVRFWKIAPEEELLADCNVAIRKVCRAALLLVVVTCHEGIVRIETENRT